MIYKKKGITQIQIYIHNIPIYIHYITFIITILLLLFHTYINTTENNKEKPSTKHKQTKNSAFHLLSLFGTVEKTKKIYRK